MDVMPTYAIAEDLKRLPLQSPAAPEMRDDISFFRTQKSIARIAYSTTNPPSTREYSQCGEEAEFYLQVRAPSAISRADHSNGQNQRHATSLWQTSQPSCSILRRTESIGIYRTPSRLLDLPYAPRPPTSSFDHKPSASASRLQSLHPGRMIARVTIKDIIAFDAPRRHCICHFTELALRRNATRF